VHPLDISTAAPCFRLLKGISFNGLSPFVAAKGQENNSKEHTPQTPGNNTKSQTGSLSFCS
jgi:hypothetical protein